MMVELAEPYRGCGQDNFIITNLGHSRYLHYHITHHNLVFYVIHLLLLQCCMGQINALVCQAHEALKIITNMSMNMHMNI